MGLGSGIRIKPIPDPGSRGQKGTGSRIRIRNIGRLLFFTTAVHSLTVDKLIYSLFSALILSTAGMDSRTLQQLADQAQHEVDMASRMVREAELQARLARAELAAKNKTLRLLQREAEDARTVRNILIPRVCMSMYIYEWNFCQ